MIDYHLKWKAHSEYLREGTGRGGPVIACKTAWFNPLDLFLSEYLKTPYVYNDQQRVEQGCAQIRINPVFEGVLAAFVRWKEGTLNSSFDCLPCCCSFINYIINLCIIKRLCKRKMFPFSIFWAIWSLPPQSLWHIFLTSCIQSNWNF